MMHLLRRLLGCSSSTLPTSVEDDERIGCVATHADGTVGVVRAVYRADDGYETLVIFDEETGLGMGGDAQNFRIDD